jgi:glycosyltransferase involved in cell wall biosynthesis
MSVAERPRVAVVRGHQANSWHLRPWRLLLDEYDVVTLQTQSNWFDTESTGVPVIPARALRDLLPRGRVGDLLTRLPGDRYLRPADALADARIVHSQDLGFWYSMQAAKLKPQLGYKLVLTVWETIPFLDTWRNLRTRPYRRIVLERTDLFLAATERARQCLLLEGAPPERIEVCAPGVDTAVFAAAAKPAKLPGEHVILSAGRLVWEKGHQDVLRAVAALCERAVDAPALPRALIIGSGPEEKRLRRHAAELGIADRVEFRANVPYEEMPAVYSGASCLVLGSLPVWFWEEQFGMVLVEALAAGLPVLASNSGAIPEVGGDAFAYFAPGDWLGLARALAAGPLSRPPGERARHDPALVARYSDVAAADRLRRAYRRLLSSSGP